jgi:hypothetical protein
MIMKTWSYGVLATLLIGCASSPPPGPSAPSGSVPGVMDKTRPPAQQNGFASRAECEKLVDHLDSVIFLTGHEQAVFRAPSQRPGFLRARVDECTVTVDRYDRDCLAGSHDVATANRCGSRFFADTVRAYRYQ